MRKALKEWALICRALASGRETLILRKGGIREEGGEFRPDHSEFLLFPTYFHQAPESVVPEARQMLKEIEAERPDSGVLVLRHFATVEEALRVESPEALRALRGHHLWSEAVVEERFRRWEEAIHALLLRVYALPEPAVLEMKDAYAGCKSWVDLEEEVSTEGALPVLDDAAFARRAEAIRAALEGAS